VNIPGNRFICEVNGHIKLADRNSVDNNIRYQFTEEQSLSNTYAIAASTDLYCVILLNLFLFVVLIFFSLFFNSWIVPNTETSQHSFENFLLVARQ
jgi:hypothetical protein